MGAIHNAVNSRSSLTYSQVSLYYGQRKRNTSETFRNYEVRLSTLGAKIRTHDQTVSLQESLSALLLLGPSVVDDSQRVTILAAAEIDRSGLSAKNEGSEVKPVHRVKYESVASVLRQCDKNGAESSSESQQWHSDSSIMTSSGAGLGSQKRGRSLNTHNRRASRRCTKKNQVTTRNKKVDHCRAWGSLGR